MAPVDERLCSGMDEEWGRLHLIEKGMDGESGSRVVAFKWTWLEWETNGQARIHTKVGGKDAVGAGDDIFVALLSSSCPGRCSCRKAGEDEGEGEDTSSKKKENERIREEDKARKTGNLPGEQAERVCRVNVVCCLDWAENEGNTFVPKQLC